MPSLRASSAASGLRNNDFIEDFELLRKSKDERIRLEVKLALVTELGVDPVVVTR
jgi:hypothetical protein